MLDNPVAYQLWYFDGTQMTCVETPTQWETLDQAMASMTRFVRRMYGTPYPIKTWEIRKLVRSVVASSDDGNVYL